MDSTYVADDSASHNTLTRRQAITAAVAVAVIPTSTVASTIDPHPAWLEEWRVLDQHYWDVEGGDISPIVKALNLLGDLIVGTPALTRDGMLAKAQYVRANYQHEEEFDGPIAVIAQLEAFLGAMA